MDIFTVTALIMTAGKVTNTMAVAWPWVFFPLYLRAAWSFARFVAYVFRDVSSEE